MTNIVSNHNGVIEISGLTTDVASLPVNDLTDKTKQVIRQGSSAFIQDPTTGEAHLYLFNEAANTWKEAK